MMHPSLKDLLLEFIAFKNDLSMKTRVWKTPAAKYCMASANAKLVNSGWLNTSDLENHIILDHPQADIDKEHRLTPWHGMNHHIPAAHATWLSLDSYISGSWCGQLHHVASTSCHLGLRINGWKFQKNNMIFGLLRTWWPQPRSLLQVTK